MYSQFIDMEKPSISNWRLDDKIEFVRKVFQFEEEDWASDDPRIVNYLVDSGYFTAPASTRFHGNHEGGLFEHSYYVAYMLDRYTEYLGLQWQRKESPWIVGLLHDLCKVDSYKKVIDGRDSDGSNKDFHYEHCNDAIISGHGEKSLIYALDNMKLTEEEMACIRYHMGAYEKNDWEYFDRAIKKYPNVLFTHMADMHASKILGV